MTKGCSSWYCITASSRVGGCTSSDRAQQPARDRAEPGRRGARRAHEGGDHLSLGERRVGRGVEHRVPEVRPLRGADHGGGEVGHVGPRVRLVQRPEHPDRAAVEDLAHDALTHVAVGQQPRAHEVGRHHADRVGGGVGASPQQVTSHRALAVVPVARVVLGHRLRGPGVGVQALREHHDGSVVVGDHAARSARCRAAPGARSSPSTTCRARSGRPPGRRVLQPRRQRHRRRRRHGARPAGAPGRTRTGSARAPPGRPSRAARRRSIRRGRLR